MINSKYTLPFIALLAISSGASIAQEKRISTGYAMVGANGTFSARHKPDELEAGFIFRANLTSKGHRSYSVQYNKINFRLLQDNQYPKPANQFHNFSLFFGKQFLISDYLTAEVQAGPSFVRYNRVLAKNCEPSVGMGSGFFGNGSTYCSYETKNKATAGLSIASNFTIAPTKKIGLQSGIFGHFIG